MSSASCTTFCEITIDIFTFQNYRLDCFITFVHSEHMKEFLKPTKGKIIFSIIFLVIEQVIFFYFSFFGTSLTPLCIPNLGGTSPDVYQNPHSLIEAWQLANTSNPCGYSWAGIDSPLVKTIQSIQVIMIVLISPIIAYILSCIILALKNKLKKTNKTTGVTSKK